MREQKSRVQVTCWEKQKKQGAVIREEGGDKYGRRKEEEK